MHFVGLHESSRNNDGEQSGCGEQAGYRRDHPQLPISLLYVRELLGQSRQRAVLPGLHVPVHHFQSLGPNPETRSSTEVTSSVGKDENQVNVTLSFAAFTSTRWKDQSCETCSWT